MIMSTEITNEIRSFFETLFLGKDSQWILLGLFDTWQSLILTSIDILVSTLFIYFVLKLFKQSRAWQLFKGVFFILAFTFISSFFGLSTISYLLSNSISILLIGAVVIFQPELRKALEVLGRSSFKFLSSTTSDLNFSTITEDKQAMVDSIYKACVKMSSQKTGALIVIERMTGLREIIDNSSTAVILDSNLSDTTLEQIFYKNSPLHDGALIIRNQRIYAARCHVPLSDALYFDKNLGTRHRAALGISEIGDSVAIVVSEERGSISIALAGKIYPALSNSEFKDFLTSIIFEKEENIPNILARLKYKLVSPLTYDKFLVKPEIVLTKRTILDRLKTFTLPLVSFILAFFIYLFVQVSINPVESDVFTSLTLTKENALIYEKAGYQIQVEEVNPQVNIRTRRSILDRLKENVDSVLAYIELPREDINEGTFTLPIKFKSTLVEDKYYSVQSQRPNTMLVSIVKTRNNEHNLLPGLSENLDLYFTDEGRVINIFR